MGLERKVLLKLFWPRISIFSEIGTMLSYFSNNRWSLQNALNREGNRVSGGTGTSEMTALDLWRTVSMAFIYAACAEFVLVNFLGKRSTKKSKVSQLQEMLDHQRQKMQQQLDRIRLEVNSKINMATNAAAATPQVRIFSKKKKKNQSEMAFRP